jgi:hypothetical protein
MKDLFSSHPEAEFSLALKTYLTETTWKTYACEGIKMVLKEDGGGALTGFIWLKTVIGSCDDSNEPSGSTYSRQFIDGWEFVASQEELCSTYLLQLFLIFWFFILWISLE